MEKQNKEELQSRYIEFQLLEQQFQQLQQQYNLIENRILELTRIEENLDDIKKVKENTDILVPVGGGIFLKSSIKDTKNVLINVGSNTITKKPLSEAKQILNNQVEELGTIKTQIEQELKNIASQSQLLQQDFIDLEEQE